MKLREILNQTKNNRNNQISFNLRKMKMKELNIDAEDILEMDIIKKLRKFKDGQS